jgi:rhodanese-related sulfurtransferase
MNMMRLPTIRRDKYSPLSRQNWLKTSSFKAKCVWLLMLAGMLVSSQGDAQPSDIPVAEFSAGLEKEKVQVLDVRTLKEYNSGHIEGAFLADWTQREQFNERIKSLDKNKPVYAYCLSGGRSRAAAAHLRKAGFKEVYNLEGGIVA